MQTILVTGANGYIGSHVIRELCKEKYHFNIVATDLYNNHLDSQVRFIRYNIFDNSVNKDTYYELGSPNICIHLAWTDGFNHNAISHIENIPKHLYFLKTLIDSGLNHLAVAGSFREYGNFEGKAKEEYISTPDNFYALAKTTLKNILDIYLKKKPVTFQWLRPFTPFGDDNLNNSILSKILIWEKEGKTTFPFTDGTEQYDYIHIDELAKQIAAVVSQNDITGIINLCSGKPTSLKEKIEEFIAKNHLKIRPDYGAFESRSYDSKIIYGDNEKILKIMQIMDEKHE